MNLKAKVCEDEKAKTTSTSSPFDLDKHEINYISTNFGNEWWTWFWNTCPKLCLGHARGVWYIEFSVFSLDECYNTFFHSQFTPLACVWLAIVTSSSCQMVNFSYPTPLSIMRRLKTMEVLCKIEANFQLSMYTHFYSHKLLFFYHTLDLSSIMI